SFNRSPDSVVRTTPESVFTRHPHLRRLARYREARASGYLALARADSTEALALFRGLSDPECLGCSFRAFLPDVLTFARLLSSRGEDRDALLQLESAFSAGLAVGPFDIERAMEIGRLAARLGDHDRALAAYRYVTHAWPHADPAAARYTAAASNGIAGLEGRSTRTA